MPISRTAHCQVGLHRAGARLDHDGNPDLARARCRDCGRNLVRSFISKRWLVSEFLG